MHRRQAGYYIALDEQEAFDIEYWMLEEAKLQRMPAPKPLVGRIALVTGGAGGIGAATAARLMADGACVMLADRDENAVEEVRDGFAKQFGKDVVRSVVCDVFLDYFTTARSRPRTVWHAPYRLDISSAVKPGSNTLAVRVANKWVNRLTGDAQPGASKVTWTALPTYRADAPLQPSGLIGPVTLLTQEK